MQRELGWEPSHRFEQAIVDTVQWYRDDQAWVDNVKSGDYQHYYQHYYQSHYGD